MLTARETAASCTIGSDIYVFGGAEEQGRPQLGINERLDTTTGAWESRAPMPTPRIDLSGVALGGKCYGVGGSRSSRATSTLEIYDPQTNRWTTGASMTDLRFSAAAGAIQGKIYVAGGTIGYTPVSLVDSVEMYDPETDTWSDRAPMPQAQSYAGSAVLNNRLYVIGGQSPGGNSAPLLQAYDPAEDRWEVLQSFPRGLGYLTAVAHRGKIYAIGGLNVDTDDNSKDVYIYDPTEDEWTKSAPLNEVRNRHVSEVVDNELYVIGGARNVQGNPHGTTGSIETLGLAGFGINFGLSGGWFNPETSGQGILIEVLPASRQVFMAWFTYVAAPKMIGSSDHRWLTGLGTYEGSRVEIDLRVTSDGFFDDPVDVQRTEPGTVGTVELEFTACDAGTMSYDWVDPPPGAAAVNTFSIQRLGPPPQTCLDLAGS